MISDLYMRTPLKDSFKGSMRTPLRVPLRDRGWGSCKGVF